MGTELDEDLIEATIRRVAEAKAARTGTSRDPAGKGAPPPGDPAADAPGEADAPSREAEVERIDSMIRHVAASKAARLPDAPSAPSGPRDTANAQDDAIEATIRRVAEAKAAQAAASNDPVPAPGNADDLAAPGPAEVAPLVPEAEVDLGVSTIPPAVDSAVPPVGDESSDPSGSAPQPTASRVPDEVPEPAEDLIEATIRRVAAAKAAQAAAEGAAPVANEGLAAGESSTSPAPSDPEAASPRPLRASVPPAAVRHAASAGASGAIAGDPDNRSLSEVVGALQRELTATKRALESLTARVDALAVAPPRIAAAPPRATASDDDDWDEAPSLPRVPHGQPIRPAIFRDPSPQTATAAQLEPEPEEVILDMRPLPEPLPPLHAAPKRGFDLLPRMYRVTVEDKRRGVDLVPLHRALLGMDGVRDMSLLSYSNGTAIVSLETLDVLNADALCHAISRAMARDAKVEVHNEQTMVVKLAEE